MGSGIWLGIADSGSQPSPTVRPWSAHMSSLFENYCCWTCTGRAGFRVLNERLKIGFRCWPGSCFCFLPKLPSRIGSMSTFEWEGLTSLEASYPAWSQRQPMDRWAYHLLFILTMSMLFCIIYAGWWGTFGRKGLQTLGARCGGRYVPEPCIRLFCSPYRSRIFHKPYICRPVMSGTAVLVTEASCRPLTMCLCNSIINCNSVSTHENKIPFASPKAMKKAFPYLSEQGIGYTGYRSGESGWGDKSLPRTGHIHVSQLSLGEEHSLRTLSLERTFQPFRSASWASRGSAQMVHTALQCLGLLWGSSQWPA